jgi:tetratricopeptide (TPR) repeat protein
MVGRLKEIFDYDGYHPHDLAGSIPFSLITRDLLGYLNLANNDIAILYDRLWVYFNAVGNLTATLECAHLFRKTAEACGNQETLATSYSKLGEIFQAQGEFEQAQEIWQQLHAQTGIPQLAGCLETVAKDLARRQVDR